MATEVYSVNFRGHVVGNNVETVLHVKALDSDGAALPTDIALKLANGFNDSPGLLGKFYAALTQAYVGASLIVKCVTAPGAASIIFQPQLVLAGGQFDAETPGDTMPPNVAGALRLDLPVPRRSGRVFMPSVPESGYTDGLIDATYQSAVEDFAATLVFGGTFGTCTWGGVVYHKDGYNGGFSTPSPTVLQYVWQQGGRRYPLGG